MGLELGNNIRFWGKPLIDIRSNGKIIIGDGCQLISTNIGSHVNYGTPVKLFVDRPNARIEIGRNCNIAGAGIHAYEFISIGDNCIIGSGSNIFDANGHPIYLNEYKDRRININDAKPIIIEKNVWVAIDCVVLPGSKIGEGSIISANSVVSGEIPPNCIAAGNPAVVIKKLQ